MHPLDGTRSLTLNGSQVDEMSAVELTRRHPLLEKLTVLFCSKLTDVGVAHLTQLSLRKLELTRCDELTEEALKSIARIESLESLTLVCGQFSGKEIIYFTALKQLRKLDLSGWPILHGENYKHLAPFTSIKRLAIGRRDDAWQVRPETVIKIIQLLNLERLDVTQPRESHYSQKHWADVISRGLKDQNASVIVNIDGFKIE